MENELLFDRFVDNLYTLYSAKNVRKCFEFAQGETRVLLKLLMTEKESISPSDLIEELNVSKQRITNILNSLKKKDYINLKMDMEDRRKTIITLTKTGREYISVKGDEIEKELKYLSSKLGKDKVMKLNELLEEINQIVK